MTVNRHAGGDSPFLFVKEVAAVLARVELAGPLQSIFGSSLAVRADTHRATGGVVDEMRPDWIHSFPIRFSAAKIMAVTESLLFIVPAGWQTIKKMMSDELLETCSPFIPHHSPLIVFRAGLTSGRAGVCYPLALRTYRS